MHQNIKKLSSLIIIIIIYIHSKSIIFVLKLKSNGSGLVSEFGVSGVLDTGIIPVDASLVGIGLDTDEKILVENWACASFSTSSRTSKK